MDEEDHKWAVFLAGWLHRLGPGLVKVADVLASSEPGRDGFGRDTDTWGGDFITDDKGRPPRTPQKLGQLLAGQADRWHGEPSLTLRTVIESYNSTRLYRVERWRAMTPRSASGADPAGKPRKPRSNLPDLRDTPESNPAGNPAEPRRTPQDQAAEPRRTPQSLRGLRTNPAFTSPQVRPGAAGFAGFGGVSQVAGHNASRELRCPTAALPPQVGYRQSLPLFQAARRTAQE